jgi:hypothetical protein
MKKIQASLWALCFVWTAGCGSHPLAGSQEELADLYGIRQSANLLQGGSDVSCTSGTGIKLKIGKVTITPQSLPAKGVLLPNSKLSIRADDVQIDATDKDYVHKNEDWIIAILNPSNKADLIEFPVGDLLKIEGGLQNSSSKISTGSVTFHISPTDGKAADSWYKDGENINIGFYLKTAAPTAPLTDASVVRCDEGITSKKDEGAIKESTTLNSVNGRENSLVLNYSDPKNTSAKVLDKDGNLTDSSVASSIGSYAVLVLKDPTESGCDTVDMGLNPAIEDNAEKEKKSESCEVKFTENTCSITCKGELNYSKDPAQSVKTWGIPSLPAQKLPAVGSKTEIKSNCATLHRISATAGQTTLTVPDLENSKKYGVVIWPVNSAEIMGLVQSACKLGTPSAVPLASDKKNDGKSRSREDCFVVTAASGNADSDAVFYWRWIRDRHLTRMGFTGWYSQNGPQMARWLKEHSYLKPSVNWILEKSGWLIFKVENGLRQLQLKMSKHGFLRVLESFLGVEEASAQADAVPENSTSVPAEQAEPAPEVTPEPTPTPSPSPTPTTQSQSEENSGQKHPLGSVSSNLQVSYGQRIPTADTDLYEAGGYYPQHRFERIFVAQSFRLLDVGGELGLGISLFYTWNYGRVTDAQGQKTVTSLYTLGAVPYVDYRLRLGVRPFFAPRVGLGIGYERFREEGPAQVTKEGDKDKGAEVVRNRGNGYTFHKPVLHLRLAGEFSMSPIFKEDTSFMRFGYGLEDFVVTISGEYNKDFSSTLSTDGIVWGLGVAFLFL